MEADDEHRTNSVGLFHTAESYWRSAVALREAKVRATHPDNPIRLLYYHAIELYLKAFLRQHHSVCRRLREGVSGRLSRHAGSRSGCEPHSSA